MDTIRVLLSLSENNDERVKVDPKIQLASLYSEIREMLQSIAAMEKRMEQLALMDQENKKELAQLSQEMPLWTEEIEQVREKVVKQHGLTLKDMLGIKQDVARLEDALYEADARVLELRELQARVKGSRAQTQARLRDLKAKYNQHAELFNLEKEKADAVMAEYASKEDALLDELAPDARTAYREALRLNPDNPVVILDGEICMGCRIGLSKQLVKQVNQGGGLYFCENCMRIILPAHAVDEAVGFLGGIGNAENNICG